MITKQQFDSLYSPDIKKSEYDLIISEIDDYFAKIIRLIKKPKTNEWFDFDNTPGEENTRGYFDPKEYKTEIMIGGNYSLPDPYYLSIPTRWLWTNKEDILKEYKEKVQEYIEIRNRNKELAKQKNKEKKEYRATLINQIKSKLTKEELKIVSFKI